MKKIVIATLILLLMMTGAYAIWNHMKLNELGTEYENAVAYSVNREPSVDQGQEIDEYAENSQKYPAFFEGKGMKAVDFSVRNDLKGQANDFTQSVDERRENIREDLDSRYRYTIGSEELVNSILSLEDERAIQDIVDFSKFYAEQNDFFDFSVAYCGEDERNIQAFVDGQDITVEKKVQLGTVLRNAELNLCPEL